MASGPFEARLQHLAKSVEAEIESALKQKRCKSELTGLVRKIDLIADEEIGQVHAAISQIAQRGAGKDFDCKAGCAWCCHRTVYATIPEALAIHDYVKERFSDDEKQALNTRVDQYVEASEDVKDRSKSRLACPFLVNDLCSIYETRPLTCRGLNSINVETCIEIERNPDTAKPRATVPAQDAIAETMIRGERTGLFFEVLDSHIVDLGLAMHVFRNNESPMEAYLSGHDELGAAKIYFAKDPFLAPQIQRFLQPAFKSDLEKSQPSGEPSQKDLARVSQFRDLFYGKGEFSKAMQTIRGVSAVELIAKMQVPSSYASEEEIHTWREHAFAAIREFATTNVSAEDAFNVLSMQVPLTMAYQGLDDKEFMKEHSEILFTKIHSKLFPELVRPIESKAARGRRIRVGYLSQNICFHSGTRWTLGWIQNHAEVIETFVLNVGYGEDLYSRKFQQEADHYFFLTRTIPENARFIKSLDLDVIIMPDAQASPRNLQYSLFRLAPVQCCGWGQPGTTGAPTMDYFLSSEMMEPSNAKEQYTEKLVLLPKSGVCYPRPASDPIANVDASHFGLPDGKPFLYIAQSAVKCLPRFDYLYKEIRDQSDLPIVIHHHRADIGNVVQKRFEKAGIRAHWLPFVTRPEYLRLMQLCQASLDTPIWTGGHTTIEALTLGKPVITLPGPYMRSRQSFAFLQIAGAPELIAKTPEDYIALATDAERQQAALIDLHADALYEDKTCALALDEFLRAVANGGHG